MSGMFSVYLLNQKKTADDDDERWAFFRQLSEEYFSPSLFSEREKRNQYGRLKTILPVVS